MHANLNKTPNILIQRLHKTPQGMFLDWNTQVGLIYQVWQATTAGGPWSKIGGPRFAARWTLCMSAEVAPASIELNACANS